MLNHKNQFRLRKKIKRQKRRQLTAQVRDLNGIKQDSPTTLAAEVELLEREEAIRQEQERIWLQREEEAERWCAIKKAKQEAEKRRLDEQKECIQAEWKKRDKELTNCNNAEHRQAELLQRLSDGIEQTSSNHQLPPNHRPEDPTQRPTLTQTTTKQQELCGFFWKTGSCRFGDRLNCKRDKNFDYNAEWMYFQMPDQGLAIFICWKLKLLIADGKSINQRCSRWHPPAPMTNDELRSISSNDNPEARPHLVLVFDNMFSHPALPLSSDHPHQQTPDNEDLLDDEDELQLIEDYFNFHTDVFAEMMGRWGRVVGLRTCRNRSAHLRGSVLVEFADPKAAQQALAGCFNRWYAGKQITARLAYIGAGWRAACCGLYFRSKCPKGDSACNFLHTFLNPGETRRDALLALNRHLPQLAPQRNLRRRRKSHSHDSNDSHHRERRTSSKKRHHKRYSRREHSSERRQRRRQKSKEIS